MRIWRIINNPPFKNLIAFLLFWKKIYNIFRIEEDDINFTLKIYKKTNCTFGVYEITPGVKEVSNGNNILDN